MHANISKTTRCELWCDVTSN